MGLYSSSMHQHLLQLLNGVWVDEDTLLFLELTMQNCVCQVYLFFQVQYSLLDRRPLSSGLVDLCREYHIDILAYGVLAGGFLTDAWLGREEPSTEVGK